MVFDMDKVTGSNYDLTFNPFEMLLLLDAVDALEEDLLITYETDADVEISNKYMELNMLRRYIFNKAGGREWLQANFLRWMEDISCNPAESGSLTERIYYKTLKPVIESEAE